MNAAHDWWLHGTSAGRRVLERMLPPSVIPIVTRRQMCSERGHDYDRFRCRRCGEQQQAYAFCEPVNSGSETLIHIRRVTARGVRYAGGVDTDALCSRRVSWDLRGEVPRFPRRRDPRVCSRCDVIYRRETR